MTEADLRIQRTIEYNLKALYPEITVRGEENPKSYMKYEPSVKPEALIRGTNSEA